MAVMDWTEGLCWVTSVIRMVLKVWFVMGYGNSFYDEVTWMDRSVMNVI